MDPMLRQTIFVIALVVDLILWALAFLVDAGPDERFRLFVAASLLLFVVLGMAFGWGLALTAGMLALWGYAIIASSKSTPTT